MKRKSFLVTDADFSRVHISICFPESPAQTQQGNVASRYVSKNLTGCHHRHQKYFFGPLAVFSTYKLPTTPFLAPKSSNPDNSLKLHGYLNSILIVN
jgi:hypothetical protein